MESYVQRTDKLRENLKPLPEEVRERKEALLDDYFEDDERQGFPEESDISDEEEPGPARSMYDTSIKERVRKDDVDRKDEYLFPVDSKLEDALEDLKLAVKQLEKASKRIDALEQIHEDLEDVSYIMYAEKMYIDFVWTIRHMLDEIVQNFRTSGEEEIGEYEPFGEGGFEINVIKLNEALIKEREYIEGEKDREEVDWSIDTDKAERGDFNKLREEHFEGLKSIAFELKECRNEIDSAMLITARRLGTAIEYLKSVEDLLEKAETSDLLETCRESRESLEQIRKSIERDTLEPLDDGLRRCETFVQDLVEGNSKEIERILDGGNWMQPTEDGMLKMTWDKPEIYEEEDNSEA